MALEYKRERELKNEELTENTISELPRYVFEFINYISVTKSDTTILSYARDLKQFIEYLKSNYKQEDISTDLLNSINTIEIKRFEKYLSKEENLSNTTIKRRMSSIASLYKFLNENAVINNNPMVNYDYPKAEDNEIIYLNERQTIDLLRGIKGNKLKTIKKETGLIDKNKKPITETVVVEKTTENIIKTEKFVLRDYAITMLILGTALRVSELVGINVSDINFEQNYLVAARKGRGSSLKRVYFGEEVRQALISYIHGEDIPNELKDKYPKEIFYFCSKNKEKKDFIDLAIKEFKIEEHKENEFKEDIVSISKAISRLGRKGLNPKNGEDALFISSWGKRLSVRSVQLMVKEMVYCYLPNCENKENITPHKLRSTAATRMLYQTEDILLVSKQLDHSSPGVTAKFYAKLLEDKEKEKLSKLSVTSWKDAPKTNQEG